MKKQTILQVLKDVAAYHDEEMIYWKCVKRQSWGRTKSLRDRMGANAKIHKRYADAIRQVLKSKEILCG